MAGGLKEDYDFSPTVKEYKELWAWIYNLQISMSLVIQLLELFFLM